jgi:hypothetical protein
LIINQPDPERHPLPDHEPIPASPDYEDQRAGDLAIGYITQLNGRDARKHRKKSPPFGFRAPEHK